MNHPESFESAKILLEKDKSILHDFIFSSDPSPKNPVMHDLSEIKRAEIGDFCPFYFAQIMHNGIYPIQ